MVSHSLAIEKILERAGRHVQIRRLQSGKKAKWNLQGEVGMCCISIEMNHDVMATGLRGQMGSPYGKQSGRWCRERVEQCKVQPKGLGLES